MTSRQELAWAAGLLDAEGSMSFHLPRGRKTVRPTLDVSQAGSTTPPALARFREAVGGGSIFGPYRGYLFYWRTHDASLIASTAVILWPWLGPTKRAQIRAVLQRVPSLWSAETLAGVWETHLAGSLGRTSREELAWAAGFFCGDGTIGAYAVAPRSPTGRRPVISISQATGGDRCPEELVRFRTAIAGRGSLNGPYAPRGFGRLPQYRWELSGYDKVLDVVQLLWPFLVEPKKSRCAEVLALDSAGRGARVGRPVGETDA